jgi:hypothetical protein
MSQHMISTRARWITCRCGVEIIFAVAEGLSAKVDSKPLDHQGEIDALVAGRWTYTLLAGELVHRDVWRIRGGLVGSSIHAEHICSTPTRGYRQPTLIGATHA